MKTRRLLDRKTALKEDGVSPAEDVSRAKEETTILLVTLKELVDRLLGVGVGDRDPKDAVGEVAHWEGEGYLYFETPLKGSPDVEIDLNIIGGRAFIRTSR